MSPQIRTRLQPIRLRVRLSRMLRWSLGGVLAGSLLGAAWFVLGWMGWPSGIDSASTVAAWAWWLPLACGTIAGLVGALRPAGWQQAAELVDVAYNLKDRTASALAFASSERGDAIYALQQHDAIDHLDDVKAAEVVPWSASRLAASAVAAVVLMLGLSFLPAHRQNAVAKLPAAPLDNATELAIAEQATRLEESLLPEVEALAEETDSPELRELAEQLEESIEELQEGGVDQREALAKLSKMQEAVLAALEASEAQQLDSELAEFAEALQNAAATEAAAQAIQQQQYQKAATALEQFDPEKLTDKERRALAKNLAKLRKKAGQKSARKGQLGKAGQKMDAALGEMQEGLEKKNKGKCKLGAKKMAGLCKQQGLKKKIGECLGRQLNRLSECKGACNGRGQSNSPSNRWAKSDSPSNNAGQAATNQPTGSDATKLDGQRQQENLSGIAGDGPSEQETLQVAEAEQQAGRGYRQRYAEFRKQMEEVLDSEPLSLGDRETVRRYFEAIRPSNEEAAEADPIDQQP